MKLLIMCEGPNELKIINILLENQKLKFSSDVLRLGINMFEFADGLGECPDSNKMVDVVDVAVRIANHLL